MIEVLSGSNTFALGRALQQRVQAATKQGGDMAVERLDAADSTFERLQEALLSPPFLAESKVVVIRQGGVNKQFVEQAESVLAAMPESTHVVLVEPSLDKRTAYYKLLKRIATWHDFAELDASALAQWLVKEAEIEGGSISRSDASYLVQRVGTDQQLLASELQKLLLYKKTISRASIDALTEATPQSTVFALLDAAFGGDAKRAMALYDEQRALKVEPQQIVAMLAWQLHVIALIKAAGQRSADEVARQAKVSPYVVKKSWSLGRSLPIADLQKYCAMLLNMDVKSKTRTYDLDAAVQYFLLTIAKRDSA